MAGLKDDVMIGMILCGGYGKRLTPLTESMPKPLIEVKDGYTILDKQLYDFRHAGIDRAILLTGYLSEKIEERYGASYEGVGIEYSREEEPLGTLMAIRMGLKKADKDVVIRNGDVVTDVNLRRMVTRAQESDYPVTVFITKMRSPYGVVEIGEDRIRSFREKPLLDYYINAGVYYVKKDAFSLFEGFESGDVEKTLFPLLAREDKLGYYTEDTFWMSIDTTKDLEEIRREYQHREDKPWGYEKILINTEKYLTKELFIREGYQTSFHYHEDKDETMFVTRGSGYIQFEDKKEYFRQNDKLRIRPKVSHAIVALENTLIQEVSTPHPKDTVRVKDPYGR
jgi:NDP-sugar pyrophosphorylase family protein